MPDKIILAIFDQVEVENSIIIADNSLEDLKLKIKDKLVDPKFKWMDSPLKKFMQAIDEACNLHEIKVVMSEFDFSCELFDLNGKQIEI